MKRSETLREGVEQVPALFQELITIFKREPLWSYGKLQLPTFPLLRSNIFERIIEECKPEVEILVTPQ